MSLAPIVTISCALAAAWMIWNGTQAVVSGHVHSRRGRIERSSMPRSFAILTGGNLIAGGFLVWAAWFSVYGW